MSQTCNANCVRGSQVWAIQGSMRTVQEEEEELGGARREFLGCVEMPLQDTLATSSGNPATLDNVLVRSLKRLAGNQVRSASRSPLSCPW